MAGDLIKEDAATGLKLYRELRADPGGGAAFHYRFVSRRGLPQHLSPNDVASAPQALKAFDQMVEWLKSNRDA